MRAFVTFLFMLTGLPVPLVSSWVAYVAAQEGASWWYTITILCTIWSGYTAIRDTKIVWESYTCLS